MGQDHDALARDRRRWLALVILCVGQLMIAVDATVVNVALPTIQRDLHFSQASLAWVVNAYLLSFGGLLLLAGRLGDLLGRTRVFLAGLGAFVASSMLCGLAPSADVLVAARFVQGASAAMVSAMALGIIVPMFPVAHQRTRALSVLAFVVIGGASLGLVMGGVITEVFGWHWIFFINVPVGMAALILGIRFIEDQPGIGVGAGADLAGAVLVTGAPMLAVYALVTAASDGWDSSQTIGALMGSLVLVGLFVAVEARVKTPLVPLGIFRHPNLVGATVVRLLFPVGAFGYNFLGVLYFQHVLGYSPLVTGLAFLPSSTITGIFSLALTPSLLERFGAKVLVVAGLGLVTAGLLVFAPLPLDARYPVNVLPTMILTGAGFGLLFMPTVQIAMSEVAPEESGLASGLVNVAAQVGAAIGVAALATISLSRTQRLLAGHHSVPVALTGGYRLGLLIAAGCTTASLVAAIALLPPRQVRAHART
jgi:EmrB/QacA subfamily drug resistance transporter